MKSLRIATFPFLLSLLLISSCSKNPEPIKFGEDKCIYCQMMIAQPNYGAELVTQKGRVHKFDALECLINYQAENDHQYAHELAIPFDDPQKLHPLDSLSFIISQKYKSPMGANLAAFLEPASSKAPDKIHSWKEVKNHVLK